MNAMMVSEEAGSEGVTKWTFSDLKPILGLLEDHVPGEPTQTPHSARGVVGTRSTGCGNLSSMCSAYLKAATKVGIKYNRCTPVSDREAIGLMSDGAVNTVRNWTCRRLGKGQRRGAPGATMEWHLNEVGSQEAAMKLRRRPARESSPTHPGMASKHPIIPVDDWTSGFIQLEPSDPWAAPIIDPNHPHDVAIMTRALRLCLRIARFSPLVDQLEIVTDVDKSDLLWLELRDPDLVPDAELRTYRQQCGDELSSLLSVVHVV
ncbi:hypothetical protein CALVIDRAFT_530889 [Calocera viscosa TUFC12733]|uniref:Uncharacterized protein n=1 Tax=Calocera viscosa (strain TUFC12733) TaxID=1330018 RepID=A0A167HA19_CALVF|nr:hypothetical protein CALVIDRAFT_530889 [Calocera viscosa TUFC12733]